MRGKVWTVGEMLIDFTAAEPDVALEEVSVFRRNAGGAPANVSVAVARLGGDAGFVGTVGNDPFGKYLYSTLLHHGVDVRYVSFSTRASTSLVFVSSHHGDPEYFFANQPGADTELEPEAVGDVDVGPDTIVHFGSNSLAREPIHSALNLLLARAILKGGFVSFDVNLRSAFWSCLEDARTECLNIVPKVHLLKVNRSELCWLTGEQDTTVALKKLAEWTPGVILCTLGADGAIIVPAKSDREPIRVDGFFANCVDATGAGDAFTGAILFQLTSGNFLKEKLEGMTVSDWERYARFACAAAAHSVASQGAIQSLPNLDDVFRVLRSPKPQP